MSDLAIRVDGLGKQYKIGGKQERYRTIRETLTDAVTSPLRRAKGLIRGEAYGAAGLSETIWALRSVSFDVRHGEVVGIIGRNGAGKSTLLKVLSQITEPSEGLVDLYGRVGSLLEVGTGFHPELTGRENVYLNGAILGMSRSEIDRKFDEIVDFAEIEKFIDTPVKHYSSGMGLRLGFAVAAHLEPEILVVDEVLAVGDAAFQKKCMGKMGDVSREGRTVLFVSHNMVAVQSLCEKAVWLDEGHIKEHGNTDEIISNYLHSSLSGLLAGEKVWDDIYNAPGNERVRLHRVNVRPQMGADSAVITMQTPVEIEISYWNMVPDTELNLTLHIYNEQEIIAFGTSSVVEQDWADQLSPKGLFRRVCYIPGDLLNSGHYRIVLLFVKDRSSVIYRHEEALTFEVIDTGVDRKGWYGRRVGVVRPKLDWKTEYLGEATQK